MHGAGGWEALGVGGTLQFPGDFGRWVKGEYKHVAETVVMAT